MKAIATSCISAAYLYHVSAQYRISIYQLTSVFSSAQFTGTTGETGARDRFHRVLPQFFRALLPRYS